MNILHTLDNADPRSAMAVGLLILLISVGVLDRATQDLDRSRTITGTVIADDPDSAATVTSVPDKGSR